MIKLLDVKSLGNSNFEIFLSHNGIKKKIVIVQREVFIDEINESLFYFNSDNRDFYDVWGQSLDFRKEVSNKVKQLRKTEVKELQLA